MRTVVASLLAIALMAAGPAAPTAPSLTDALAAIRAYAPEAMTEQGTPGLAVAITDRTHTLAVITLGYANVEGQRPVTPETRFAIGSITKSMTSLSLLELRDEHRVDLDATVQRYLPWFAIHSDGKPILVHELLSHTAGIPDDYTLAPSYLYGIYALRDAHTLFAPGTSWSYSNDGFATVGAIVAAVDRRPWAAAVQARVFAPLGMTQSYAVFTPETQSYAATGYEYRDADRPAPLHPALVPSRTFDFVDPAGSVLSTPEDMARYLRFYLNGGVTQNGTRLLTPATFAAMTHADRYNDGKAAGSAGIELAEAPSYYKKYGFGLSVFDENGDHLVGHTGGVSGYTACMQANLTRGFGVIAMANLVEAPLHPCAIVLYAMRVLRAQQLGLPLPAPPAAPDPAYVANAQQYTGTYTAPDGTALSIASEFSKGPSGLYNIYGKPNHLSIIDGGVRYTLYPRGGDLFWSSDPRYPLFLLHFLRNGEGRVDQVTYGSQWFASAAYSGPRSWRHPKAWDAYAGRYEDSFWGSPIVTRVLVVKNMLTFDGLQPLTPRPDGSFAAGSSTVRFDAVAGGKAQRMRIDGIDLYRVELP